MKSRSDRSDGRRRAEEILLEEMDLIDQFTSLDESDAWILYPCNQKLFEPPIKPFLYWDEKFKTLGFKKPVTREQLCNALLPLGARLLFLNPADGCEPLRPDQESEIGV